MTSREAELKEARQFGHLFIREPDQQRIRADFERVFKGDREALEQFEFGVVEEDQKRLTLGMSPSEFHAYQITKQNRRVVKRKSHGRV